MENGLTIGGYESAWLADLVASYISENTEECFEDSLFNGIYRDDGINVINKILSKEDLIIWLENLQSKVNKLCETDSLQFIAEL